MNTASIGHLEIIDELVTKGADLEAEDKLGMTPLLVGAMHGHVEAVEVKEKLLIVDKFY